MIFKMCFTVKYSKIGNVGDNVSLANVRRHIYLFHYCYIIIYNADFDNPTSSQVVSPVG